MNSKFVDPLENVEIHVSTSSAEAGQEPMESTSMHNHTFDQCPKCSQKMSPAKIADGEDVVYCSRCRVSSPLEV